jgi:dipeptidyl aminopeptidase/acylaminoacyl peptidase
MKTHAYRAVRVGVTVLLAACVALAPGRARAEPQASASNAGLPPLLDRELIFGDPEISAARISPDGRFIAFMKPFKGTRNIWVKRIDEPFDKARPITADTKRPIGAYFWSRDGKFILFVQDQGGDENFNVYAVNPSEAAAGGSEVPTARNLTDLKGVRAAIYAVPKSDPDTLYVGLNDRDKAWHDLYKVRISTGERTLVRKNSDRIGSWTFDTKDQLRLAVRSPENGDTEILRVDDSGFTKIYSCDVFQSCGPVRFHKDGQHVYLLTNKDSNFIRLTLLDVDSMKEGLVETDPLKRVDLTNAVFSDKTDELLLTVYLDDKPRYAFKDKSHEADYQLLRRRVLGKEIGLASPTNDERLWLVNARSDADPGETYLFDRQTKKLTLQYRLREKLPREALAPMTPIRYPSADGLEIPAYLTLPKGVEAKGLPTVVVPHGGPWARDAWGYDSIAQFLANRGYAVLQPNFRGSTGYGRQFLDAGNKQWGEKMQDDITWGVKHLIAQGTADPQRIGIFGGSYGGYATLAGVAFTPDLYAAAVSVVGPSNLITLLNAIPPYWEAGRKMFMERLGDLGTPEGRAQLERQSPLHSADKIKAPLLVIQGANDPRVNKAESEQIVVALRDRGSAVEYILAPDEGHGFARPVNNMAAFAAAEQFLAKHLGGRYQAGATPEVTERLKVLAIDPKTVERPKAIPVSANTPKPIRDLRPGTSNYKVRIEMGAQKTDLTATSEVKDEGGTWVVTETMKTPAGDAVDRGVLEKGSLLLRKRSVTQGPISVDLDVKDGKATGEMKMNGQARPVAIDVGGDLIADGPGASLVVATLPLADGYTTTFRNVDLLSQQARATELKVVGSEQVTVPAGSFDAFKVDIAAAGGPKASLWISKDSRAVVKVVTNPPQMNGATITLELDK